MIVDTVNGKRLCPEITELTNSYSSATSAYTEWADQLGVSPTVALE